MMIMDHTFIRQCEHPSEDYWGIFGKEPPVLCCKQCFTDGVLTGAKKVVDLKTE